ncbi:hypothetical protein [Desulfofustis limnaeus]|jgi:hypothetical protein|uniref:Lipoprotein n=1 Tax=Desulfofustis limnaeus TaxID=2740163 RepID=A0ABN6M815_9BACT|nr:hypothetical protein [Desulfofustis limnaeus]MDX9894197.1 hypothetical protein [Desulfofustis sp.]BDD87282.1 hypothetical protein DPPLL_16470 [Desulfofustis limnaeus]
MFNQTIKTRLVALLSLTALVFFSSCASQSTAVPPATEIGPIPSVVSNFDDIELPADMELNLKKTMSIKTDSFRGGILHYSGRVELHSLKDFIIASMKNNQWKHVGEASYDNILLAFTKPNKTCMVVLSEGFGGALGKTYLELYLTVDMAASKKLNPFGEPIGN